MRSRITGAFTAVYAHRIALWIELEHEPVGFALHSCPEGDNPLCCNARHLRDGTAKDNVTDAIERGRFTFVRVEHVRGEANNGSILTELQVHTIRASGAADAALADVFGVSAKTIRNVRARRSWTHIP